MYIKLEINIKSDFFEIRFLFLKMKSPLCLNIKAFLYTILITVSVVYIFFKYGPFLSKIISLVEKLHLIYITTLYFFYKSLSYNKRNLKFLKWLTVRDRHCLECKLQNHKTINNYHKLKEFDFTLLFKI